MTTLQVPIELRDRINAWRSHPRQPGYEVIAQAVQFWEPAEGLQRRGAGTA